MSKNSEILKRQKEMNEQLNKDMNEFWGDLSKSVDKAGKEIKKSISDISGLYPATQGKNE